MIAIQATDPVTGVAALLQAINVGIAEIPASRTLPGCAPTVPRLRICGVAASPAASEIAVNFARITGCSTDFAQLHRRTEAKISGWTHFDSAEFLQALEIHQRGWRYDILFRQIDDIDAARKCDIAIFGQSAATRLRHRRA